MTDGVDGRKRWAASVSIAVALSLVVLKVWAAQRTSSAGILASLVDSGMDVLASTVNFFSILAASRPPDADHSFGHGKAEALAGLFQSLVIAASGLYLVLEAFRRFSAGNPLQETSVGFLVMGISIVASIALTTFLRASARRTGSLALQADSLHYITDVASNGAVIFGLVMFRVTGSPLWDLAVCLAISGWILWSIGEVGRRSLDIIMDRELPTEECERIHESMRAFKGRVYSYHRLKTRKTGTHHVIEVHLVLPAALTFQQAHDTTEEVVDALEALFPRTMVIAHYDPFDPAKAHDPRRRSVILTPEAFKQE